MARHSPLTDGARRLVKEAFVAAAAEGVLYDEAAVPAYAHRNPLVDRIFWGRLAAVEAFLAQLRPRSALDFGCGSGIMSYVLSGLAARVVASDIDPSAYKRIEPALGFPPNVEFVDPRQLATDRFSMAFEAVVALDVLEHVPDLGAVLSFLQKVLKPGGVLVVSGPTENILYRAGRGLAGGRFTGSYHLRDIYSIERECRRLGQVKPIATIYPFAPLFRIFVVRFAEGGPQ